LRKLVPGRLRRDLDYWIFPEQYAQNLELAWIDALQYGQLIIGPVGGKPPAEIGPTGAGGWAEDCL